MQNRTVQERLAALAVQVEALTRRIRTIGLSRAAEDLDRVSNELRRLTGEARSRAAQAAARVPAPGAETPGRSG